MEEILFAQVSDFINIMQRIDTTERSFWSTIKYE